ncbi:MAG TPA: radical SAM protein [Dehalococcoidia bacterium]|jgi:pyruvate-formate lyase-activating enzyme|nr:radical SAM protein [Dehalococcoidia bacterium]
MNVYHITYAPAASSVSLYFWGCNLNCLGCLRKNGIYDCHLEDVQADSVGGSDVETPLLLDLERVMKTLEGLKVETAIFMGGEPSIDPELPQLAQALHRRFACHNILLTNGFMVPDLGDIDEVVFSIKAYNDHLHRRYTGQSNREALRNFKTLSRSGVRLRSESVFIPQFIDVEEIEAVARFIASVDKNIPYRIDAYIPVAGGPWRKPLPQEMDLAQRVARKHLTQVSVLKGGERLRFRVVRII